MNDPAENSDWPALNARIDACMIRDRRRLRRRVRRLKGRRDRALVARGVEKIVAQIEASQQQVEARSAQLPHLKRLDDLPIETIHDELAAAIEANQVVIVQGETGSGKTTRLGRICLELGRGVFGGIAHTQPRRIAARSVARRIASELPPPDRALIGHHVRFDRSGDEDDLLTVMTDGVLLASIRSDPRLERWDTIILDEAHERSLNIDFLIGVLRSILPRRPELRVIVTSATIDAERFSKAFSDAPVVTIPGRTYPVEILHRPPASDLDDGNTEAISRAVLEAVREADQLVQGEGDMLVFLPGEAEIRSCIRRLSGALGQQFEVLPLYARLSATAQDRVMRPGRSRRIICATNVAETSLTVPRIRAVIDSGLARVSRFSAKRQVQRLPLEGIARDSARQRAGRAGRVAPGVCIRLWSTSDHGARDEAIDPELRRSDLAGVLLRMADLNLGEAATFPFLDRPKAAMIRAGERVLEELGATTRGELTPLGREMASLPVAPRVARMLLAGRAQGCLEAVRVIAAGLSIPDPRLTPHDAREESQAAHAAFIDRRSDFMSLLNLWEALSGRIRDEGSAATRRWCMANHISWVRVVEWRDLVHQLRRALRGEGGGDRTASKIHRALMTGLLIQVGRRSEEGDYEAPGQRRFHLHPSSALAARPPAWVMVGELVETRKLYGRVAAAISPHWLEQAAGHLLDYTYERTRWDTQKGEATVARRALLRGLTVSKGQRVPLASIEPQSARRRFIDHALVDGDCDLGQLAFFKANETLDERLRERATRMRRTDLLRGPAARAEHFDEVLPHWVHSPRSLRQWLSSDAHAAQTMLLSEHELLTEAGQNAGVAAQSAFPDAIETGAGLARIVYRHNPGEDDDGLSLRVGIEQLPGIDPVRLAWLVPGWRRWLVETLLRGLPKDARRALAPMRETIDTIVRGLPDEPSGSIHRAIEACSPHPVASEELAAVDVPAALLPRFEVTDEGRVIAVGRDLPLLRRTLEARRNRVVARALEQDDRHGQLVEVWPQDEMLPRQVRCGAVEAHLVLDASEDGVRLLLEPCPRMATQRHRLGVRRLLVDTLGEGLRSAVRTCTGFDAARLCAIALGRGGQFEQDAAAMTVELACPGPTPDSAGRFEEVATQVWDQLVPSATRAIGVLCDYLQSILRCRDDLAASSLAPEALVELQQAYDFLAHVSIPGALPPAWWPMPARWARLLSERVARGDPNGAVLARSISQWQDRAGLAEARLSHPSVMQYRLLLESRRAQLHGGDSGGVRVDDALLAQQWALVEATA